MSQRHKSPPAGWHAPNRRQTLALVGSGLAGTATGSVAEEGLAPLDLSGHRLSFSEDFDRPPEVSAWGPSKWIAHTPWNGDFGAARFTDPGPGQAWATTDGLLRITARRGDAASGGRWTTGLLASSDRAGGGFRQALGYFEARLRFPLARGVWPAFWLVATHPAGPRVEIDVVEFYGRQPQQFRCVAHLWPNGSGRPAWGQGNATAYGADTRPDDFNLYGAMVTADAITYYFNRRPVWRVAAPADMREQRLTVLVNLAIEPDIEPGEHRMDVDHVRAWAAA
ncbi:glycoside hydrolase family 16 protein [Ideonella sp. A 288]|uniref:glycoside hydrolase family 16 protein n=1 Tax=Ideonella sp. A 288 TaxID=1962181 RepID=UPI000B4C0DF4|nr:glycoside hydrolase family 16 protein [Ideonella sp. A 288]